MPKNTNIYLALSSVIALTALGVAAPSQAESGAEKMEAAAPSQAESGAEKMEAAAPMDNTMMSSKVCGKMMGETAMDEKKAAEAMPMKAAPVEK